MNSVFWASGRGRVLNIVLVLLGAALLWEAGVAVFHVKAFILPPPSAVLR